MAKSHNANFAANPLPPIQSAVGAKWPSLRNELVGRAAVELQDDFANGLFGPGRAMPIGASRGSTTSTVA